MQSSDKLGIVSDVYLVKVVDISYLYGRLYISNLLNMLLFSPMVVAWDRGDVGLSATYKNPLPKLPRPDRVYHSFFSLCIFLTILLSLNRPLYLSS